MKLLRTLFSALFSIALVVGLMPSASVFADSQVPSWGDPSINYGARFESAVGNFEASGVTFGESRPAQLDRWQSEFAAFHGQGSVWMDKYDVFDLLKQLPTDNFDTRNGYGLIPWSAPDKIKEFVKMANGNPDHVLQLLNDFQTYWPLLTDNGTDKDKVKTLATIFYGVKPWGVDSDWLTYVRSWMLVMFSGGRLDHNDNTPTDPFDPGQPNGTAHFQTSPWPKINQATVQGSTIHVDFTTYGLNNLHRPTVRISNGTDSIDKDFGWVNNDGSHDTYNGTWDVPVSEVTSKLGPLDKLTVIVTDGYGRTAQAPLKPGAVLTYHWGSNYHVSYTPGQPAVFTQPLVLTLDQMPSMIDPKTQADTFQWSYSVDGGAWKPLNVMPDIAKVFDQNGNPKQKIVITTDTLNQIAPRSWAGGSHTIRVQVTASPGDQGQYLFSSQDSGTNQPSATVTVTFDATHPLGQQAPGQAQFGPLALKWGQDLPNQVPEAGYFTAPVEISNNGDLPVTTTLDFTLDGTVVIMRVYEGDGDKCKAPPPDFMNFPLKGTIEKTFTIAPHSVVWWNVRDGISYIADGYKGPSAGGSGCISWQDYVIGGFMPVPDGDGESQSSPVTAPLSVGHSQFDYIDDKTHEVHFHPNYAAYIKVTPKDPQDYLSPYIDAWVGVKGMSIPPGRPRVHLVQ